MLAMDASSRYWEICRISLERGKLGYEYRLVPTAREFFNKQFMELETQSELSNAIPRQNGDIQAVLLSYFQAKNYSNHFPG